MADSACSSQGEKAPPSAPAPHGPPGKTQTPPVITITSAEVAALLERVREQIAPDDYQIIAGLAQTVECLDELLAKKDVSLAKLRQLIFGETSERLNKIFPKKDGTAQDSSAGSGTEQKPAAPPDATPNGEKAKGHGRNGADDYPGAERIKVPHPGLKTGCACPNCQKGRVYRVGEDGRILRIIGRPLLLARLYEPERWRCNLCGEVFTAPLPPEAGDKKYDETAGSIIALAKYGTGIPFYRLEGLQASLQVPLPAATQWEIVAEVARQVKPVWEALLNIAAQGSVLHNDDTTMRVLSLMKENDGPEAPERKGVFTSGIVALVENRKLGFFFTGRKHAGERLEDLLKRRAANAGAPIQMCDGLDRNLPEEFKIILGNCLVHGRRKFVEQAAKFPDECQYVLERLAEVYRIDAQARARGLNPAERLALHQAQSEPVMEKLHLWMTRQLAEKKVEPNSGLGDAINYMLKRWNPLTLFLRQAGAPLDNNICEQALKMAILHRKNALFYKTETGALVGDILMGIIHTCRLNEINPFDYLTALQKHAAQVRAEPSQWLPWNYQDQLPPQPGDTG